MMRNAPITAQFEATCTGCGEGIVLGERIRRSRQGWCHEGHFRMAIAHEDLEASITVNPVYLVVCPYCGADQGERCRTRRGTGCPVHAGRQRQAQEVAQEAGPVPG